MTFAKHAMLIVLPAISIFIFMEEITHHEYCYCQHQCGCTAP